MGNTASLAVLLDADPDIINEKDAFGAPFWVCGLMDAYGGATFDFLMARYPQLFGAFLADPRGIPNTGWNAASECIMDSESVGLLRKFLAAGGLIETEKPKMSGFKIKLFVGLADVACRLQSRPSKFMTMGSYMNALAQTAYAFAHQREHTEPALSPRSPGRAVAPPGGGKEHRE